MMYPGPYDPYYPMPAQQYDWTCSVRTAWWMLASIGCPDGVEQIGNEMLNLGIVTPAYGLMDASGYGLAKYLSEKSGYPCDNQSEIGFEELKSGTVGQYPYGAGGRRWYHWIGVRYWGNDVFEIANSAPGYKGVYQTLTESQFYDLGPFSAVWLMV